MISTQGQVIRVPATDIRQTGRPSMGVHVMRLKSREKVATVAPVITTQVEEA